MSYWRQPWGRVELEGRSCRLQVLDPQAAFELEGELNEHLGSSFLVLLADPQRAVSGVVARVAAEHGTPLELARDPNKGAEAAALALALSSQLLSRALAGLELDGAWAASVFERLVFDRLKVDGAEVGTWREWSALGLRPWSRWLVMSEQLRQTFGPLWRRSPYQAGGREPDDFGVPETNAPIAVQWAATIAKLGLASSAREVLVEWTPEQVIDVVETAARDAEIERRSQAAAEAKRSTA